MPLEFQTSPDPALWKVLLVDDEPAVHEVSRLILAGLTFEGRAIELLSASSAAQARELLGHQREVALVLLDVVMETDDAGLALVHHIREELQDLDMQIVLRTGQPGMAPEREVVLRYEINGYVLKTEITAQRLHSIVISALRSFRHSRSLRAESARHVQLPPRAYSDPLRAALTAEIAQTRSVDAIVLQVQPEIALASNEVVGIELVPQWKTSQGMLSAARVCEVLPEGTDRRHIALWLLAQGCEWARIWRTNMATPMLVSMPIIGDSLGDCALLDAVLTAVHEAQLPKGVLDFLVTESTLASGQQDVYDAMVLLRAAGVSFTLLDFGAQSISLPGLSRLTPDRLKIHRHFVRCVADDTERMALARSVIALAQTLHIVAIADGIANDSDTQFFKWEGCELGQGDALAPACEPAGVAEFIQHGRRSRH